MSNGNDKPGWKWRPLAVVVVAVAAWGLLLAVGAYLQPGADQPRHDLRRFWVVMACVGGFLGLWGLALWLRSHRRQG